MMILIIAIHVTICLALIGLVLIQRGRGSGLVESLSGVESVFGTKTNAFLTRTTTILSILFFITCLSLAIISVRQSKSLMRSVSPNEPIQETTPLSDSTVTPVESAQGEGEGAVTGNQANPQQQ